jgi:hypothetical protein
MSCLNPSPIFVGALASAIAQCCTDEELEVLAAVFTQLGDSLALILATQGSEGSE